MSLPLEAFTVLADPHARPQVLHADDDPDAAERWHGWGFMPDEHTSGALVWDEECSDIRCWTWPA
jgi:hypothetical protein